MRRSQRPHRRAQSGLQPPAGQGAAEGLHGRPGAVGGQVEDRQLAASRTERRAPELPQPLALGPGEARTLPGDVAGVGGAHRSEARGIGAEEQPLELAEQQGERPEVGHQVVHGEQQHVLLRAAAEDAEPHQRSLRAVEGAISRGVEARRELGVVPIAGVLREEFRVERRQDLLGRLRKGVGLGSVGSREDRAQGRVPLGERLQAAAQGVEIERPPGDGGAGQREEGGAGGGGFQEE